MQKPSAWRTDASGGRGAQMTSILVFVADGEPAQIAAAHVISFAALVINMLNSPYVSSRLDNLQVIERGHDPQVESIHRRANHGRYAAHRHARFACGTGTGGRC